MKKKQSEENLKSSRQLYLYNKLMNGGIIDLNKEAEYLEVTTRTIHRDIDGIRAFLKSLGKNGETQKEILSDHKGCYYISGSGTDTLSGSEALAVCKILIDSRAFCKDDMTSIINKLLKICAPQQDHKDLDMFAANELYHYAEPQHKRHFIGSLSDIGRAVNEHRYIDIVYEKIDGSCAERRLMPAEIMFSGYYFCLVSYVCGTDKDNRSSGRDGVYPAIYRIDRIKSYKVLERSFNVPFKDRFEENEFRKRVQFMYGGMLRRVTFIYKGADPETVLDRFPTAAIQSRTDEGFIISAEAFGSGIDMWIRSQGDKVQII